ncbi:polysaccharide lyase 8 family protein [Luteipulveratus mongoliensis]|uniref:Hyaluronate lyase n=1 Tax=Luteipulveratus mongoliensis TaxID=571913 RepID=A0A0K1JG08_9MICO|nr:polysaccharide lyase 8 family protein [Luteipulveratus mongoliensis]AKU15639.1 hypothetical protein VV02_06880 [Luteipulveratus mongoliensis]
MDHNTTPGVRRRTVLQLGAAGALGLTLATRGVPSAAADTASELATLRARRRDMLTGGVLDTTHPAVRKGLATLADDVTEVSSALLRATDRTSLFADLPFAGQTSTVRTANIGTSYRRLTTLALGWATPGLTTSGSESIKADLVAALRFLHDVGYRAGLSPVGNWWFWEIGNPAEIASILALAYDIVPAADRTAYLADVRYFAPNPNRRGRGGSMAETGANRSDKALACVVRGILDERPDEVVLGRDALSDVADGGRNSLFRYVTSGDGFYRDGSFIQHDKLPYVGTYGNVALAGSGQLMSLLSGTTWAVTDPQRSVLLDAVESSFAPFVRSGRMMETVRGRAVSRQKESDAVDGFGAAINSLMLATTTGEPYERRFKSLAKGWIERCSADSLGTATLPQLRLALPVLDQSRVKPTPEWVGHRQFAAQERSVHHRPGWAFTVSTSSSRIGRYEWGNRENNEGWYQGDGMTYLHLDSDQDHYADDYWPTVDPYRLPGVTNGDEPRANGATDGTGIPSAYRPFAGGGSIDDRYGLIAMDHEGYDHNVRARKSWFCLDDMVIALGSGVTATGGRHVWTTVEQRNLGASGSNAVQLDGAMAVTKAGDTTAGRPSWVHLDGVGGYVLLGDNRIQLTRRERSGTWRNINSGGDTAGDDVSRTRSYVSLAIDHGTDPTDDTYAYALLPGASVRTTRRLAANLGARVLTNTPDAHVLEVRRPKLLLASCFAAANTPDLVTSASCVVLARETGPRTRIVIGDPSRTTQTVTVTLPKVNSRRVVRADSGIRLIATKHGTTIEADLGGRAGATLSIDLSH